MEHNGVSLVHCELTLSYFFKLIVASNKEKEWEAITITITAEKSMNVKLRINKLLNKILE